MSYLKGSLFLILKDIKSHLVEDIFFRAIKSVTQSWNLIMT